MKSRIVVLPFYHLTEARTTTASVVMTLFLFTLVRALLPTRFILNEISERLNSACRSYFGCLLLALGYISDWLNSCNYVVSYTIDSSRRERVEQNWNSNSVTRQDCSLLTTHFHCSKHFTDSGKGTSVSVEREYFCVCTRIRVCMWISGKSKRGRVMANMNWIDKKKS